MMHLWDLIATIWDMVRSGKRRAKEVARWLQVVKDDPEFMKRPRGMLVLLTKTQLSLAGATIFYKKHFGLTKDFSDLVVPRKPRGAYWLLVVAKGLTPMKVFARCKALGWNCVSPDRDLDDTIPRSDRKADKDYAIWVEATLEADENFEDKSYCDLEDLKIRGITLLERLLLGLQYNDETDGHLDGVGSTLCSGSKYDDGQVPIVRGFALTSFLAVTECDSSKSGYKLRSRAVVES